MDPVTVNLSGLGPFVYIAVEVVIAIFFGIVSWRNILAAGRATDASKDGSQDGKQNSHIAIAIVSGIIGLANMIFSLNMFWKAFEHSF